MKNIQSFTLVYRYFSLLIYSFFLEIAILVKKAEQLAMGIPILRLTKDKVLDVTVDLDPIKISVRINNTYFLLTLLYFFL